MGELPRFEKPTTPEEERDLVLDRSEYLLEHIKEQNEQHGIDHLTGVSSRKVFERDLRHALEILNGTKEEHRAGVEPLKEISVIFIDLDHFKQVNDTSGHAAGDEVLKKVAELMRNTLRESDVLARYGGDEFVVLLLRTGEEQARVVAEHLRASLDNDSRLKEFGVTASFGVCSSGALSTLDSETLITQADKAAYRAKQGGRNRVEVYTENAHTNDL